MFGPQIFKELSWLKGSEKDVVWGFGPQSCSWRDPTM